MVVVEVVRRHASRVDAVTRARADLDAGRTSLARARLKGVVAASPRDREARGLLAEAYRRDRLWAEAGRWGYLVGPDATDRERRAFELHCGFGGARRITEVRLRRLLRTDDLAALADEDGRARLRDLPRLRHPRARADGPLAASTRALATVRARRRWR